MCSSLRTGQFLRLVVSEDVTWHEGKKHVGEAFATRSIRKLEMFEVGQLKIIIWFPSFESLCTNTNIFEASYVKSKKGIIARFSKPDHFQAQMDYVLKSTTFTVAILNTSIVVLALRNELQHGTLLTMPSQPTTSRLRLFESKGKRVGDLGPSLIRTFCPPPKVNGWKMNLLLGPAYFQTLS